jgi:hypothetical protein
MELEKSKFSLENTISQMRSVQEMTEVTLERTKTKKEENEQKLRQIENLIKEVHFNTCGALSK